MSAEARLTEEVERMLEGAIQGLGLQLMDVEYRFEGRWVLRLVIDGKNGVSIDDCAAVSELAGQVLDEQDPIPNEYSLEVSSPGVFRPLKKPKHFQQSLGREVKLRLAEGHLPERKNRTVRGTITAVGEDEVTVETESGALVLPFVAIQSAKLDSKL